MRLRPAAGTQTSRDAGGTRPDHVFAPPSARPALSGVPGPQVPPPARAAPDSNSQQPPRSFAPPTFPADQSPGGTTQAYGASRPPSLSAGPALSSLSASRLREPRPRLFLSSLRSAVCSSPSSSPPAPTWWPARRPEGRRFPLSRRSLAPQAGLLPQEGRPPPPQPLLPSLLLSPFLGTSLSSLLRPVR